MTDLAALLNRLPPLALDLSGALAVLISLYFLFAKARAYWPWSNASLLPYFIHLVWGKVGHDHPGLAVLGVVTGHQRAVQRMGGKTPHHGGKALT